VDYLKVVQALADLGTSGLMIFVIWRLADKWAGKFLAAQEGQAQAMSSLAQAVKDGQGEQREVLLAVRVMATKLDEVKEEIRTLRQEDPR
jgi:hypothetical protein